MKTSFILFQENPFQLISKINWVRADNRYVVVDPYNKDILLYLNEKQYNKMVVSAISADNPIITLASPDDTRKTVESRYSESGIKTTETPHLDKWMTKSSKLFSFISGWKVDESMIDFKRNFDQFFPIYYKDLCSWLGLSFRPQGRKAVWKFSNFQNRMLKTRGINQVILILKISSIATLQFISGTPMKSTASLGQRITMVNGLPKLLPPYFRKLIRSKNTQHIRVIMSLLSSFKAFKGKYGKPDLSSISSPKFSPDWGHFGYDIENNIATPKFLPDWSEIEGLIPSFWKNHFDPNGIDLAFGTSGEEPPLSYKAGPNSNPSILGAGWDALAIIYGNKAPVKQLQMAYHEALQPGLFTDIVAKQISNYADDTQVYAWNYMWKVGRDFRDEIIDGRITAQELIKTSFAKAFSYLEPHGESLGKVNFLTEARNYVASLWKDPTQILRWEDIQKYVIPNLLVGKLAIKHEPAGKIRVFAISDYWTQWICKDLNDSIFDILREHPSDATFDQIGKVEKFSKEHYRYTASFDLKSATDLIPVELYVKVLAFSLGEGLAQAWSDLLVQRDYTRIYNEDGDPRAKVFDSVRYTRGQPMGTLSSWGGLALVHHFLVYIASQRAKVQGRFLDYLVLGDDIVIGDERVADHYKQVCVDYGVTIGLPKSFISRNGFFQFASQNIIYDDNISPISLREVMAVSGYSYYFGVGFNLSKLVEFINRAVRKGFVEYSDLIGIIRLSMTSSHWNRTAKQLSRGIIPHEVCCLLVSLLCRDVNLYKQLANVQRLIASIRGDYRLFTGNLNYSSIETRDFLVKIIKSLHKEIFNDLLEVHKYHMPENAPTDSKALNYLYKRASVCSEEHFITSFDEIKVEFRESKKEFDSILALEHWNVLYNDSDGYISVDSFDLGKLFQLRSKLQAHLVKRGLEIETIDKVGGKLPFSVSFHLALLSEQEKRK